MVCGNGWPTGSAPISDHFSCLSRRVFRCPSPQLGPLEAPSQTCCKETGWQSGRALTAGQTVKIQVEVSKWLLDPLLIKWSVSTLTCEGAVFVPISLTQTLRLGVFGELPEAMPSAPARVTGRGVSTPRLLSCRGRCAQADSWGAHLALSRQLARHLQRGAWGSRRQVHAGGS